MNVVLQIQRLRHGAKTLATVREDGARSRDVSSDWTVYCDMTGHLEVEVVQGRRWAMIAPLKGELTERREGEHF